LLAGWGTEWALGRFGPAGVLEDARLFLPSALIVLAGLGFGVIGCLLAGALPAQRASRLSPVEALRNG
jgi:ABC-type antimicrobial peptide transport system permease subunit